MRVQGLRDDLAELDLPISMIGGQRVSPAKGAMTDASGTVTTGGTAQVGVAANPNRSWFFFSNQSVGDLYIRFDGVAAIAPTSILVPTRTSFVMDHGYVDTGAVSVFGATTAQAYTLKTA
jgi:hypothetical protein